MQASAQTPNPFGHAYSNPGRQTSRYLIEQTYMLSSVKKLFYIHEDAIDLCNLQDELLEQIYFGTIVSLQCSEHNEKEFAIITNSGQHNVFSCTTRNSLLTEIYQHFDPFQKQEKEGSGEVSVVKWSEDNVIQQRDLYYEEQSSLKGKFQVKSSSILIQYKKKEDEEDMIERESKYKLMSPSRSSIADSVDVMSRFVVYYIDIEQILTYDSTMYIIQNNSDIQKFIFPSADKLTEGITNIRKNSKAYLNLTLEFTDMKKEEEKTKNLTKQGGGDQIDEKALLETLYKTQLKQNVIYRVDTKFLLWNNNLTEGCLEITEDSIYLSEVLNQSQFRVKMTGHIRELKYVVVKGFSALGYITFIFVRPSGAFIEMQVELEKRDEMLSTILCLRQLLKLPYNGLQIFNHSPDFSQITKGLQPELVEAEFESSLFKKVSDSLPDEKKQSQFSKDSSFKLMNQFIFNCSFYSLARLDNKCFRDFADEFKKMSTDFLKQEEEIIEDEDYDYIGGQYIGYGTDSENESENSDNQTESEEDEENDEEFNQSNHSMLSEESAENKVNQTNNLELKKEMKKPNEFEVVSNKLSYLLCILKILLNGRQVFRELLVDYQDLIHKVMKLLNSRNPFISYMSNQVIYSLLHFYNNTEARAESNNKRELIKGSLGLLKYIRRSIFRNDKLTQQSQKPVLRSLYVWSIYELMASLICSRKQSTLQENYWIVVKEIFEKKDLKFLHILDRFSMTNNLALSYGFARILNQLFKFLQRGDTAKFKELQKYFLVYTVQLIYSIYMALSSPLLAQRNQSIVMISKLAYKNKQAVSIMLKLFKKSLFMKVETPLDLFTYFNWEESEWQQFFNVVLRQNYDSATEQWKKETLITLLKSLKDLIYEFIKTKIEHQEALSNDKVEIKLTYPTHEFESKQVVSKIRNLRWNFDEISLKFKKVSTDLKVSKYYLSKLLNEGTDSDGFQPSLNVQITGSNAVEFLDELILTYIPSQSCDERKLILKVIVILYQTQFASIRELRTMPYWVKLLELPQFRNCQFLILQLIYQSLSVQQDQKVQDVANANTTAFIDSDGLRIIISCLVQIFSEFFKSENVDLIDPTVKLQFKNYTDQFAHPFYFNQTSENINIGILCFHILDLIMKKDINRYMDPLPKDKAFILEPENVSIITSLMLLQNNSLTKQILYFVEDNLYSQFALYKFRKSGFIEYLFLYLDTELAQQAYRLLIKMQDVTVDYNKDINFQEQFDQNDLNIIHEGGEDDHRVLLFDINAPQKDQRISKNSIFLRYLPLPLLKKAHQQENQGAFIEIFQSESYEKATLIWNREMKEKLKETILINSTSLMKELKAYVQLHEIADLGTGTKHGVPRYEGPVREIIKYPFIENEVRCGQYYLRVWTQQKAEQGSSIDSSLKIPVNEEQFLMDKLKFILENLIENEEQIKEQQKLIILLKSCLLALKTFQKKRLFCLQQIKDVVTYLCGLKDLDYNDYVKKILYIGVKIIFISMHQVKPQRKEQGHESESLLTDFRAKVIEKEKQENLSEVLGFNGIEIINDIIGMILYYSKQAGSQITSHMSSAIHTQRQSATQKSEKIEDSSYDLPMSMEEKKQQQNSYPMRNKTLNLDKYEAKTILFGAKALKILIQADIQKYLEHSLVFRTTLFKQLSKVLDISYSVVNIYKQKSQFEKNKNMPFLMTEGSPLKKTLAVGLSQAIQQSHHGHQISQPQQNILNMTTKNALQKGFMFGQSNLDSDQNRMEFEQKATFGLNIYQKNPFPLQTPKYPSDQKHGLFQQNLQPIEPSTYNKKKTKNTNYKLKLIFQDDHYSKIDRPQILNLIFRLAKSILGLGKCLSLNPNLHPEIIQSGFAWKCLQHENFSILPEFRMNHEVNCILKDATYTLQHITSFAKMFATSFYQKQTNDGGLIADYKRLSGDPEKGIILEYNQAIQKLLEKKIIVFLECDFERDVNSFIKFNPTQEKNHFIFLKIFSIPEERTPEIIWNDQTRQELQEVLEEQLSNIENSFSDVIMQFDYSINKTEIRIENIYVKNINSDIYFRVADTNKFVEGLVKVLKSLLTSHKILQFDEKKFENVFEIIKAFRNLIQYQSTQMIMIITTTTSFNFEETIGLLCSILKIKDNEFTEQGEVKAQDYQLVQFRFKTISSIVFDILKIISKTQKFAEYLVNCLKFAKLITRVFSIGEKDIFDMDDMKKVVTVLQNILNYDQVESDKFLIKNGLVMFFLHTILEKNLHVTIRRDLAQLLKLKIDEVAPYVGAYLPIQFFYMGEFLRSDIYNEDDQADELISCLEEMSYENQFIIWNSDLKDAQHHKVKDECERIIKLFKNCQDFESFDANLSVVPFQNPKFMHEIIISDVILRVFNRNSTLFINTSLEVFFESLCLKMDKQVFSLSQIFQILKKNDVAFEAQNQDQYIEVNKQLFTSKQIRKKLHYISQQTQYVLSSILLTLEQILYNDFNPNKRRGLADSVRSTMLGSTGKPSYDQYSDQFKREQQSPFLGSSIPKDTFKQQSYVRPSVHQTYYQQQMELLQGVSEDAKNLPEIFVKVLEEWFEVGIFENLNLPIELRLTFQQLIILVLDVPEVFKKIKNSLMKYLNEQISRITFEIQKSIEKIFILVLIQKIIKVGGQPVIESIFDTNFHKFIDIHALNNKTLCTLVEYILILMKKSPKCKEQFYQLSRSPDQFQDKESKINWKEINNQKIDTNSEQYEAILKIWRPKAYSVHEAKTYYMVTDSCYIEKKLDETNLNKIKLPLITKKAVEEMRRKDIMGEDELNTSNLIEDQQMLEQKEKDWERNKEVVFSEFRA